MTLAKRFSVSLMVLMFGVSLLMGMIILFDELFCFLVLMEGKSSDFFFILMLESLSIKCLIISFFARLIFAVIFSNRFPMSFLFCLYDCLYLLYLQVYLPIKKFNFPDMYDAIAQSSDFQ